MKRAVMTCAALLFSFAIFGTATAGDKSSPESVKGATTVDTSKAKELFDRGVVFVDVRSNKDWDAGRIPGAEHLELKSNYSEASLGGVIGKDAEVVMYCNGEKCLRSSEASEMAAAWGFKKIYYYRDGFPAWQGAGYPVE